MEINSFFDKNPIITINIVLGLVIMCFFWLLRNDKKIELRSKISQEKCADLLITVSTNVITGLVIGILVLPLTPLFSSIFDTNSLPMFSSDSFLNMNDQIWILFIEFYTLAALVSGSFRKAGFDICDRLEKEGRNKSKFSRKPKK